MQSVKSDNGYLEVLSISYPVTAHASNSGFVCSNTVCAKNICNVCV